MPSPAVTEPHLTQPVTIDLTEGGRHAPAGARPPEGSEPAAPTTLAIKAWPDPVIDLLGVDPRSAYVERYWLGILGPSTTWLLRRIAAGLEASPAGFDLDLAATATALGLGGKGGRHSPFMRALGRCCQFELAQHQGDALAVRRKVPPLSLRQVTRLPEDLQRAHATWQEGLLKATPLERMRKRSRSLALSFMELGHDLEDTERQLARWRFHPAICHESALWANARHREARAAADTIEPTQS